MLNFLSIVLILLIVTFLLILKRKYIINLLIKPNFYFIKKTQQVNQKPKYAIKKNSINYARTNKYSEFERKALREKMWKLFKGPPEDKLKALNIAKNLGDKSTLPILRIGLKDMDPSIVKLSALLIRKFR